MDINAGKVTTPLGINSPDNFFKGKDTHQQASKQFPLQSRGLNISKGVPMPPIVQNFQKSPLPQGNAIEEISRESRLPK
ncbi:MAG: hypothetical protein J1F29_04755 [Lentimicrobiaceae bacterium]|nr:hypothetical protein [Lentimicrobiaceae bacterium]